MSYYQEADSHIKDNVKVAVGLTNYATKEDIDYATGVDTSNLAAKKFHCFES